MQGQRRAAQALDCLKPPEIPSACCVAQEQEIGLESEVRKAELEAQNAVLLEELSRADVWQLVSRMNVLARLYVDQGRHPGGKAAGGGTSCQGAELKLSGKTPDEISGCLPLKAAPASAWRISAGVASPLPARACVCDTWEAANARRWAAWNEWLARNQ